MKLCSRCGWSGLRSGRNRRSCASPICEGWKLMSSGGESWRRESDWKTPLAPKKKSKRAWSNLERSAVQGRPKLPALRQAAAEELEQFSNKLRSVVPLSLPPCVKAGRATTLLRRCGQRTFSQGDNRLEISRLPG